jgi:fructose/tagatose bisphosphate aldolase
MPRVATKKGEFKLRAKEHTIWIWIWDFRGPQRSQTCQHFMQHMLQEFADYSDIALKLHTDHDFEAASCVAKVSNTFSELFLDKLKPNRLCTLEEFNGVFPEFW